MGLIAKFVDHTTVIVFKSEGKGELWPILADKKYGQMTYNADTLPGMSMIPTVPRSFVTRAENRTPL